MIWLEMREKKTLQGGREQVATKVSSQLTLFFELESRDLTERTIARFEASGEDRGVGKINQAKENRRC